MGYLSVSFTHKNTDIFLREKLSLSNEVKKREILRLIKSSSSVKECFVLSTCNRVEIFAVVDDFKKASNFIILALSRISGVESSELENRADIYEDNGAIHHLFCVAASLDSLVVGETQIVGQLKEACNFAKQNLAMENEIEIAIHYALKCAAQIRNKTEISKNPISVSSVAVAMAKEKLGSLEGVNAVVIGAGEMSELACKHLIANGAKITILNRNIQNGEILANKLNLIDAKNIECENFSNLEISQKNVSFDSLSNLKNYINKNNLFFSATGSQMPIITDDLLENVDFKRYFFDIAVPRDIEINMGENIEVYAVDDLEEIVKKNLVLREKEASIAYSIVGKNTTEFFKKLNNNAITPLIKALRITADEVSQNELNKALIKGYLKNSDKNEAKKLIQQVLNAFLHKATINLKNLDDKDEIDNVANVILDIFDLNEKYEKFINLDNKENDNEI